MDFETAVPVLIDWKTNNYNIILVIIDCIIKIVHYKLVKTTINIAGLVKVIINIVIKYYYWPKLIISN